MMMMFSSPSFTDDMEEIPPPCSHRDGILPCDFMEDERRGEEVCRFCGRVGRRILYTGQERVFDEEDKKKKLRSDEGYSSGFGDETRMGQVYVSNASQLIPGSIVRDATICQPFIRKRKASEKKANQARDELASLCSKMRLKGKTTDDCLTLFDEYVSRSKSFPKSRIQAIKMGVIFHACRKNDESRTIGEISRQTGEDKRVIMKGMKLLEKVCCAFQDKHKVNPINLIERYCTILKMDPYFMFPFLSRVSVVDYHINPFLIGKKPNTIAAIDMVLTFRWFYDESECDINAVAQMAKLHLPTLIKRIAEVEDEMKKNGKTVDMIVEDSNWQ